MEGGKGERAGYRWKVKRGGRKEGTEKQSKRER